MIRWEYKVVSYTKNEIREFEDAGSHSMRGTNKVGNNFRDKLDNEGFNGWQLTLLTELSMFPEILIATFKRQI